MSAGQRIAQTNQSPDTARRLDDRGEGSLSSGRKTVREQDITIMILPRKTNPQAEYRKRAIQRVNDSIPLAEKFPKLSSLALDLAYFAPDGLTRTGELRYKVHVKQAKSVISLACPHVTCVAGEFDLSDVVADALAHLRKFIEGEIRCSGSRQRGAEVKEPCGNLLRYKVTIGYV